MKNFRLNFSFTLLLLTSSLVFAETRCPGNVTPVQYHSLQHSQIAVSVKVNGSGPYEFMVDTGAQVTLIDPVLADELKLEAAGSIGVVAVTSFAKVPLVSAAVVEAGPVVVHDLQIAVEGLGQIQTQNPNLRGILGNNFLSRFDLLIDHGHKMLCFEESRLIQQAMQGERVPLVATTEPLGNLQFAQPIRVRVHLQGDHAAGTILRVDSGSNAPLLFGNKVQIHPWLQKASARRAEVANGSISLAITPAQDVKIGGHLTRQVAFLTPIRTGQRFAKAGEDGLLPTTLFRRVFISYRDGFLMFDPK